MLKSWLKKGIVWGIIIFMVAASVAILEVRAISDISITQRMPLRSNHLSPLVNWTQQMKLLASDGTTWDEFGFSVSLSGDTALIGVPADDNSNGSVYVFIRNGTTWVQQAKILAPFGVEGKEFGFSVTVDGDTALIGVPFSGGNVEWSGSVYIFTRTGTIWTQQAKLNASDGIAWDGFGYSASISGDTAIIGAYDSNGNIEYSGSAYVFTRTDTTWTQQAKLLASDGAAGDKFGLSVSLSGDTALIGAPFSIGIEAWSGSTYVFTRQGTTWTQQQKLNASDGAAGDKFGLSVSLSGDTALIGADCDNDTENYSGSAYVFIRDGTTWVQQAKFLASDGPANSRFGSSVSLNGDTAFIGAKSDNNYTGSVYIFTRTGTIWKQQTKLIASDGVEGAGFGWSVSLSGDTALIGAPFDNVSGQHSGSAYMFAKENQPPNMSTINGPLWGIDNIENSFYTNVTDPDEDGIYCMWNWGDGNITNWLGPYFSGETINASHSWSQKKTYEIRVKLKDVHGAENNWSDPHFITIRAIKKSFVYGRYTNMSAEDGFITIEAVNLRMIQSKPFQFLHYIAGEIIMFSEEYKGIMTSWFIFGRFNVVE